MRKSRTNGHFLCRYPNCEREAFGTRFGRDVHERKAHGRTWSKLDRLPDAGSANSSAEIQMLRQARERVRGQIESLQNRLSLYDQLLDAS